MGVKWDKPASVLNSILRTLYSLNVAEISMHLTIYVFHNRGHVNMIKSNRISFKQG